MADSFCKDICETYTLSWLNGYALEFKTVCRGCGRTEYEIQDWPTMTEEEKVVVATRCRDRMKKDTN